jgi:hypothetical protein
MSNENQVDNEYENLKNSKFKQQKLAAWRPVPTITSTSLTFLFFGIAFIVIGIIVLSYSNKIVEVSQQYETVCGLNSKCKMTFNVESEMVGPIMIYYQLNNFYQNHRRYVKSKSNSQLKGTEYSLSDLQKANDCDPIFTMKDLGKTLSFNNKTMNESAPANPCGLIAKSLFTDTYAIKDSTGKEVFIDETNIAWEADKKLKYAQPVDPTGKDPNYWQNVQWTNTTNEHFMVWMRPAGLPNFRKLWGRVAQTMAPGNYTMEINSNYDVAQFKGQKLFVLSTVNSFGGKNSFLGISYIVVGCICVVMAIAFVIGYNVHNSKNKKES